MLNLISHQTFNQIWTAEVNFTLFTILVYLKTQKVSENVMIFPWIDTPLVFM